MGRIKEFEDKKALEKAMFLFWERGYENTSLKELLSEMNILNGSFYHSYGAKKNVFIKALACYEQDFREKRIKLFSSEGTFSKKIRILFEHVFDRQKAGICPKGCFLFNSVSSDSLKDDDIRDLVKNGIKEFATFIEEQLRIAITRGEVDQNMDPEMTSSILISYMQGILKLCILEYSDLKFREQTEYFLSALGMPHH